MPIQAGFGNGSFRTYGLTKRAGLDRTGTVEYLIIAGGGAGGSNNGGGGGAGGILQGVGHPVNAGSYVVTVGAGGASIIDTAGSNGSNSVFDTLVAIGGGGGAGTGGGVPDDTYGRSGGSGGGGTNIFSPGSPRVGLGTPGQGNNGGQGNNPGAYIGGGGGGAGSAGGSTENANGGIGIFSTFSGSNTAYGGGGGGSGESGPGGAPPWGRGGAGYVGYGSPSSTVSPFGILEGTPFGGGDGNTPATQTVAFAGVNNTGGGGGGTGSQPNHYGGNGGSGIVIIRYPISYANSGAVNASYAEVNGYRIFTFAATGSLIF